MKLWDVASNTAITTFNMGSETSDQQLGCLWQKDHLLSVSLSGYINYLDKNNPDRPLRILKVTKNLPVPSLLHSCRMCYQLPSGQQSHCLPLQTDSKVFKVFFGSVSAGHLF